MKPLFNVNINGGISSFISIIHNAVYLIPLPPLRRGGGKRKRENKGINNCIIISNDSPFFMIPPFISRRSRKHWYNTTMRGYWHGPSLQEALINEQEEGEGGKKGIVYTLLVYIYIRKHWRQTHCAPRYIEYTRIWYFPIFPGKNVKMSATHFRSYEFFPNF